MYSSRMRKELTAAVMRGDSDNTILQWFIQTYGTVVMATPTHTGFNRVAWIMPYAALVLGIGLVVFIVWVWKMRPRQTRVAVSTRARGAELDRFRQQAREETEL
jgi:cytochrome c-type biogenesis protein CcmH/NrfF